MTFSQLLDLGRSERTLANRLVNLNRRLGRWKSHLEFLAACKDHGFVPRGLRLSIRAQSAEEESWRLKAEHKRVLAAFKAARRTFFSIKGEIGDIYIQLDRASQGRLDLTDLRDTAQNQFRTSLQECERTKGRKFSQLLRETPLTFYGRKPPIPPPDTVRTIINLSNTPLSADEKTTLGLGGKFSFPPSEFPAAELAARAQFGVEMATQRARDFGVTGDALALYHNEACHAIAKAARGPPPKVPLALRQGLRHLLQGDRVVVPADKARALVVLDRQDYTAAILRSLQPPVYKEVFRDPSSVYNKDFGAKLLTVFSGRPPDGSRRDFALKERDWYRYKAYVSLQKSHGRPGAYYGMVKTHKYDRPPETEADRQHWISTLKIRPICPGYRCVDLEMTRHLTKCLQLLPRPRLSVQSAMEVLDLLSVNAHYAATCRLVSLDVVAMFPSIPTEKAVPMIRDLLNLHKDDVALESQLTPDQLADFLDLSIRNTHLVVQDGDRERWWVQCQGLGMGKSYCPVVADQYLGVWEEDLTEMATEAGGAVLFACRYADDFLVGFRGDDDALSDWLRRLNTKEEAIQVTLEMEVDGYLPYLDVGIQREDSGFTTTVYRKACNTDQVVPFTSFTDPKYLQNAVAADVLRAARYCSTPEKRKAEVSYIHRKFSAYGYPNAFIAAVVAKTFRDLDLKARALPLPPHLAPPRPIRLAFPFFGPGFHALRRQAAKIGLQIVAKPKSTIASSLCSRAKHKLPTPQTSGVVYEIKCGCGSIYIGESGREVATRIHEHKLSCEAEDPSKPFGGHKACNPDFDAAKIVMTEDHYRLRLLLESAMIRLRGQRETVIQSPNDISMNRNAGALLNDRWLPIVNATLPLPPIAP